METTSRNSVVIQNFEGQYQMGRDTIKEYNLNQWRSVFRRHQPDSIREFFLEKFYEPFVENETKTSINGFDFDLNNILKGIVIYIYTQILASVMTPIEIMRIFRSEKHDNNNLLL